MKLKFQNKIIVFLVLFILMFIFQYVFSYFLNYKNLTSFIVYSLAVSFLLFLFYLNSSRKQQKKVDELNLENQQLSKSLARYEFVTKATSDTIWDWDLKTNEIIWNKGIQNIFGYKETEVGNNLDWLFSKIHPEDSLKMSVKLYSFVENKAEKWQDNYRFLCADGTYKYVFDRGFLVLDDNRDVVKMVGSIQDVTKQKLEEQRLKLLERVITETKDAIIITEIDADIKTFPKIIYVNPAFTTMTGFTYNEVIDKTPLVFLSKKSIAENYRILADLVKKKEEFYYEGKNHRKNTQEYWVNLSMLPIKSEDEEHTHWISIQRDITTEKHREFEREQLIKELIQNNKDLKQFSYITSHNLRAPLSNLTGLLGLIEDITIEDEELNEIIEGFTVSTNLLNQTVNDLVKVIVIKDNLSIQKENIEIQVILENVIKQISTFYNRVKPTLNIKLDKQTTLFINKSYLESILLNLMTNSLKYNQPERKLEINISLYNKDESTILEFSDNGIGIDLEKNKDKIFGLYQRFHDYPDSKGLGLYLVKSQVESMGGSIEIKSVVNLGTTFTITFKNN